MAVAPILTKGGVMLVKLEATSGSDPTLAAADAIAVEDVEYGQEIEQIEQNILRGTYAPGEPIPGKSKATISFTYKLRGSGTAGTAPPHGPLMQACGYKETDTANSDTYTPDPSGRKTCAIKLYRGGHIYLLLGCAGVTTFKATPCFTRTFKMTGSLAAVTDGSVIASPVYAATKPLAAKSCAFTYASHAAILREFGIEDGAEVAERENINAATGYDFFLVTGFKPKATLKVEDEVLATYDWRAQALASATIGAWTITNGGAAGNICTLTGSLLRLAAPKESEQNGIRLLEFTGALLDSAASTCDFLTETWT